MDSQDPFVLCTSLLRQIEQRHESTVLEPMQSTIGAAIERCRAYIDVGVSLPWAFYATGVFYLLLKKPYESFTAYTKAIDLSSADWMIDKSLQGIQRLAVIHDELPGYEWVERLHVLACASTNKEGGGHKALLHIKRLARGHNQISGPVSIVAGGCDARIDPRLNEYRELLFGAFKGFRGTIISGGTTAGISALVGDVQEQYKEDVITIGYVPRLTSVKAPIDRRYREIRPTDGTDFSPLEAITYWGDLIASGIAPSSVKFIGIDGGSVSASEYRIALALGAPIGILEGSGHEAAQLLADRDWHSSPKLLPLPANVLMIRAFIRSGIPTLAPETRETLARAIHEEYRASQQRTKLKDDPSMADWDVLNASLKQSNREQADDIVYKLHEIGYTTREMREGNVRLMRFTDEEVERLAEMEHARWMLERLRSGWRWGPEKSVEDKVSPYLVPWQLLSEEVKGWDRNTVRQIPQYLEKMGIEVR